MNTIMRNAFSPPPPLFTPLFPLLFPPLFPLLLLRSVRGQDFFSLACGDNLRQESNQSLVPPLVRCVRSTTQHIHLFQ